MSWATTGASNGTHQLSARARDAAGNEATSAITYRHRLQCKPAVGPIAAYALNESSGIQAFDSSGSGFHGILVQRPQPGWPDTPRMASASMA